MSKKKTHGKKYRLILVYPAVKNKNKLAFHAVFSAPVLFEAFWAGFGILSSFKTV